MTCGWLTSSGKHYNFYCKEKCMLTLLNLYIVVLFTLEQKYEVKLVYCYNYYYSGSNITIARLWQSFIFGQWPSTKWSTFGFVKEPGRMSNEFHIRWTDIGRTYFLQNTEFQDVKYPLPKTQHETRYCLG